MCVMAKTLFGEDAANKEYYVIHEYQDGKKVQIPIFEAFRQGQKDMFLVGQSALNFLFPFCAKYNIGASNKRLKRNVDAVHEQIRNLMRNSTDRESVCYQIKKEGKYNEEELLHDLVAMLGAGFDTSARTATGTLFQL